MRGRREVEEGEIGRRSTGNEAVTVDGPRGGGVVGIEVWDQVVF